MAGPVGTDGRVYRWISRAGRVLWAMTGGR